MGKSTSIISDLNVIVLHLQSIVCCLRQQIAHLLKIAALFGLVGFEVPELNTDDSAVEIDAVIDEQANSRKRMSYESGQLAHCLNSQKRPLSFFLLKFYCELLVEA